MTKKRVDLPVTLYFNRYDINNKWQPYEYRLDGLLLSNERVIKADKQFSLLLQLYSDEVVYYYHNLSSDQPKVMVVLEDCDSEDMFAPILVSVNPDLVHAYSETNYQIEQIALSASLYSCVEEFVLKYYDNPVPYKRKRKSWHDSQ